MRLLVLSVFLVLTVACEQPQQPIALPDTTGRLDSARWERIELLPQAFNSSVIDFNDSGTILGWASAAIDSAGYDFIYKDGLIRRLHPDSSGSPSLINSTGLIVGIAWDWRVPSAHRMVALWDSPDAMPRRLDPGPLMDEDFVSVVRVNDQGDILVRVDKHDGLDGHGPTLLWRNGARQDLGYLAAGPFQDVGYPSTRAADMNERGQIVGSSKVRVVGHTQSMATEVYRPFIWENGVMRELAVLGPIPCTDVEVPSDCSYGWANDINEQGVVLGHSAGADGVGRAVIWENGVVRDLGAFPGSWVFPMAINDRNQVLANVDDGRTRSFFLWDRGQTQTIIRGDSTWPRALGANGEVIGSRSDGANGDRAWVWEAGTLTDLGPGTPIAINRRGDIIGNLRRADNTSSAILWRRRISAPS